MGGVEGVEEVRHCSCFAAEMCGLFWEQRDAMKMGRKDDGRIGCVSIWKVGIYVFVGIEGAMSGPLPSFVSVNDIVFERKREQRLKVLCVNCEAGARIAKDDGDLDCGCEELMIVCVKGRRLQRAIGVAV